MSIHLGQHGNFLWFQGTLAKRFCSSGNCFLSTLRPDLYELCQSLFPTNHCAISATAINVAYVSHVRLSLPGVVLLRERDQGHAVWLQAFHPRGCAQDLLLSPCRAMVRSNNPGLLHPRYLLKVNIAIYLNLKMHICHYVIAYAFLRGMLLQNFIYLIYFFKEDTV